MRITLGRGNNFRPIRWNSARSPHLLIAGATGWGKTNLLRHLVRKAAPKATIYLVDGGSSSFGYRDQSLSLVYDFARTPSDALQLLKNLNHIIDKRVESKLPIKPAFLVFEEVAHAVSLEPSLLPLIERIMYIGPYVNAHLILSARSFNEDEYDTLLLNSAHVFVGPADKNERARHIPMSPYVAFSDKRGTAVFCDATESATFRAPLVHY